MTLNSRFYDNRRSQEHNSGQNELVIFPSQRKQPTFREATTRFPAKWRLSNDCRNSIQKACYYRDLGSSSDWWCRERNLFQPIRSTTHILVVTGQQYGISEGACYGFSEVISRGNKWGVRLHVKVVFEHQKRRFSKSALRVEIVENASFSCTSGRTKTDAFDHTAYGMLAYFHRFSVFVWTAKTIQIRYEWTLIFLKTEKMFLKSPFLKISKYVKTRP